MSAPSSSNNSSHIKKGYAFGALLIGVDAANLYLNANAPMTKIATDLITGLATGVSKVIGPNLQSPSVSSVDLLIAKNNHTTATLTGLATVGLVGYGRKKWSDGDRLTGGVLMGTGAMTLVETVSIVNSGKLTLTPFVLKAISDMSQTVANTVPSTTSTPGFMEFITSNQTPSTIIYTLLTICLGMWAAGKDPFAWLKSSKSSNSDY